MAQNKENHCCKSNCPDCSYTEGAYDPSIPAELQKSVPSQETLKVEEILETYAQEIENN